MKTLRQSLLEEIDAFCAQHKMTPTEFGRQFRNDTGFVGRLRSGERDIVSETIDKTRNWMAAYKPPKKTKRAAVSAAA